MEWNSILFQLRDDPLILPPSSFVAFHTLIIHAFEIAIEFPSAFHLKRNQPAALHTRRQDSKDDQKGCDDLKRFQKKFLMEKNNNIELTSFDFFHTCTKSYVI